MIVGYAVEDSRLDFAVLDMIRCHERAHLVDSFYYLPFESNLVRVTGLLFRFLFSAPAPHGFEDGLECYTTRPDTLFGAAFVGISPGHPLAERIAAADPKAAAFIADCARGGTSEADIEAAPSVKTGGDEE